MPRALIVSMALLVCLSLSAAACAQEALRIAVVNPAKIFTDMKETKDLKERMEKEGKDLANQEKQKQGEVQNLQDTLKVLNPGSSQFLEKEKQLLEKAIMFDTWKKINQAQLQQQQKLSMKLLFDKITEATKAVAEAEKLDLVISETNVDFPDINQINVDQLRQLINQRNVIFNSGKLDISPKITAKLDADYASGEKKPG